MTLKATAAAAARPTAHAKIGRAAAWLSKQVEIGLTTVDLSLPQYRVLAMLEETSALSSDLADPHGEGPVPRVGKIRIRTAD